jgi:hypothetical protein
LLQALEESLQSVFGNLTWLKVRTPKTQMQGTTISMKYAIACFSSLESVMKAYTDLDSWTWDEATANPDALPRPHHLKVRPWNVQRPEEWQEGW